MPAVAVINVETNLYQTQKMNAIYKRSFSLFDNIYHIVVLYNKIIHLFIDLFFLVFRSCFYSGSR